MRTRLLTVFVLVGASLTACGGDEENGPSGGPSLGIDGGIPRLDGGDPTGLTDGGSGTCKSQVGKQASNTDLLNACAEGCQPFDNAKRLPGYQPGKLPPLQ